MNREIDKLYKAYEVSCPFELARKLELKIHYVDFPKPIYGYYKSVLYTEPVLINMNLPVKLQKKTCEYLMVRHLLYTEIEFCLDEETFEQLELMTGSIPLHSLYQLI